MPYSPLQLVEKSVRSASGNVFHYTGAAGVLGMIQNRTLRASEASGMNDLAEVRQGWSAIIKLLEAMPRGDILDLLLDFANDPMEAQHEVFVLCAAHDGDDANQWRLYGDQAKGYAVELDSTVALGVVSATATAAPVTRVVGGRLKDLAEVSAWLHVMYSNDEIENALVELIASVRDERARIDSSAGSEEEASERWQELSADAYGALSTIAHLIKSPGFSGEREVRLVTTFMWIGEHVHYRAGAYGIVGYVELGTSPTGHATRHVIARPTAASPLGPLPILSIRLGPQASKEQKSTLEALLNRQGLGSVRVTASEVPLR